MRLRRWSFCAVLLAAPLVAAQEAAPPPARQTETTTREGDTTVRTIQEEDRVVVRKKAVVDFTDVTVDGELTRPEGSYVLNKKRTRFKSLIKDRDNFVPELQKSVDNL